MFKLAKLNQRSTDLAHVMHVLNDYEVPKIAFFGFTCPLTWHTGKPEIQLKTNTWSVANLKKKHDLNEL